MRWTKLKQLVEERMASSLEGRVELHRTRYHAIHDNWGRAWITVDKQQVWSTADDTWFQEQTRLANELRAINRTTNFRDPEQRPGYEQARHEVDRILEQRGLMHSGDFDLLLREYLSLSIEDALASESPVVRALAMTDARLGKRRLRTLASWNAREHELVKLLYRMRCLAEGIAVEDSAELPSV